LGRKLNLENETHGRLGSQGGVGNVGIELGVAVGKERGGTRGVAPLMGLTERPEEMKHGQKGARDKGINPPSHS